MMIEAEPKVISFHNVTTKQEFTTNVRLLNVLDAPVNLIVHASSPIFQVYPNEIALGMKQAINVTVKMYLDYIPNMKMMREDFIFVKLKGETQTLVLKIPIEFSIVSSSRSSSSSPSPSSKRPVPSGRKASKESSFLLQELHAQNLIKDRKIRDLDYSIGNVARKHPDLEDIVESVRREERVKYEERSQKILFLFRQKDEEIENMKHRLDDQEKIIQTYREISNTNKDFFNPSSSAPSAVPSMERIIEENTRLNEELIRKNQELRQIPKLKELVEDKTEQLEAVVAELHGVKEKMKLLQMELKKKDQRIQQLQFDFEKVSKEKTALDEVTQKLQDEVLVFRKNFIESKHYNSALAVQGGGGKVPGVEYEPQAEGGYGTATPKDFEFIRNDPSYAAARLYKDIASDHEERYRELSRRLQESMAIEKKLREELETVGRRCDQYDQERKESVKELEELKKQMNFIANNYEDNTKADNHSSPSLRGETSGGSGGGTGSGDNGRSGNTGKAPSPAEINNAHMWWQYVWHDLQKQYNVFGDKDTGNELVGIGMRKMKSSAGDYDYPAPDTNAAGSEEGSALIFHSLKLKDNLRLQAIEISSLRQELFGVQLRSSEEIKKLQYQIKTTEREKQKLIKLLTYQKQEKEIEISSLKAKIQSLTNVRNSVSSSSFGEKTAGQVGVAQIASLHNELETEKIANFHLRLEMEETKQLFDNEKQKATVLQNEVRQLESTLNTIAIVQTIKDIPGISPYHVMEVFSIDFMKMKQEMDRLKHLQEDYQEEIKHLQRKIHQLNQAPASGVGNELSDIPPLDATASKAFASPTNPESVIGLPPLPPANTSPRPISRRMSVNTSLDEGRQSVSSSPIRSTSPLRLPVTNPAPRASSTTPSRYEQFMRQSQQRTSSPKVNQLSGVPLPDDSEPIHLRIDNETTPKLLLQSLDVAILKNKCLSQEKMIEQLEEELRKHTSTTSNLAQFPTSLQDQQQLIEEQFHAFSDYLIISKVELIEYENNAKKLQLTSYQLEEVQKELDHLKESHLLLEKQQVEFYSSLQWLQAHPSEHQTNRLSSEDSRRGVAKLQETLPLLGRGSDSEGNLFDDDSSSLLQKAEVPAEEQKIRSPPPSSQPTASATTAPPMNTVKDLSWSKKYENLREEHRLLRVTLQERTSQLKVLMETLESLQIGDSNNATSQPPAGTGNTTTTNLSSQIKEMENNLFDLAYNPSVLPIHPTSSSVHPNEGNNTSPSFWVNQTLSKRIIELSTELLSTISQQTHNQQEKERNERILHDLRKEKNLLTVQQAKHEKEIQRQQQIIEQLISEQKQTANQQLDENFSLKTEKENYLSQLKQKEVEMYHLQLSLDECKQQLHFREKVEYLDIFQTLLSLHPEIFGGNDAEQTTHQTGGHEERPTTTIFSQPTKTSEQQYDLKEMIANLLLQWKETEKRNSVNLYDGATVGSGTNNTRVGSFHAGNVKVTRTLHKNEKEFLQKVSDFVLQLNDYLIRTQEQLFQTQQSLANAQKKTNRVENSITLLIQEILRLKKRLVVYEKTYQLQSLQLPVQVIKSYDALFQQRISSERSKKEQFYHERNQLKRQLLLLSVEYAVLQQERSKLLLSNAIQESKGSPYFQEKEEHLFAMNTQIAGIEKKFLQYIEKEIPRLLSGMPVSEIDRFTFFHPATLNEPWLSSASTATMTNNNFLGTNERGPSYLTSIGLGEVNSGRLFDQHDQVTALTQSLCLAKVNESKLEMKLTEANEKLYHYKEKYSKLETVLLKWKEKIEEDLANASSPINAIFHNKQDQLVEFIGKLETDILLSNEKESNYLKQVQLHEQQKLAMEEEIIEYRNKLQLCEIQCQQLQQLLHSSLEQDEIVKQKAIQQLNRLRLDLENQQSKELKSMRRFYEDEKQQLIQEIQRLSQAITENMLDVTIASDVDRVISSKDRERERAAAGSNRSAEKEESNDLVIYADDALPTEPESILDDSHPTRGSVLKRSDERQRDERSDTDHSRRRQSEEEQSDRLRPPLRPPPSATLSRSSTAAEGSLRKANRRYSSPANSSSLNVSSRSLDAMQQEEQNNFFNKILETRELSEESKQILLSKPSESSAATISSSSSSSQGRGKGLIHEKKRDGHAGDKENIVNEVAPSSAPLLLLDEKREDKGSRRQVNLVEMEEKPKAAASVATGDISIDATSNTGDRAKRAPRDRYPETQTEMGTQTVGSYHSGSSRGSTSGGSSGGQGGYDQNRERGYPPPPDAPSRQSRDEGRPLKEKDRKESQEEIIFGKIPARLAHRRSSQSQYQQSDTFPGLPLPTADIRGLPHQATNNQQQQQQQPFMFQPLESFDFSDNNTLKANIEAIEKYDQSSSVKTPSPEHTNLSSDLLLQLQQENFHRTIEMERRKSNELSQEIRELEELLEIQQRYIHEHLDSLQQQRASTDGRFARMERNKAFEEEVRKEDTSLWPSFPTLCDELLSLLHTILSRSLEGTAEFNLIRSAIATANRLKISPFPTSSSMTAAAAAGTRHPDVLYDLSSNNNVEQSLSALAKRMKLIEHDLLSEEQRYNPSSVRGGTETDNAAVPERYLYLLRDLRYKVNELQDIFQQEFTTEKDKWLKEKAFYVTKLHELSAQQEATKKEQQHSVDSLKEYYEKALQQTQDSLENNTRIAKREIERLEGIIKYLNDALQSKQQDNATLAPPPANNSNSNNNNALEKSLLITKEHLEEYYILQKQLQETMNALERQKIQNSLLLSQLNDEKQFMGNNFSILKKTYEQIIENLENKLSSSFKEQQQWKRQAMKAELEDYDAINAYRAIDAGAAGGRGKSGDGGAKREKKGGLNIDRVMELESNLQELEHRYHLKCSELETILKVLASTEQSTSQPADKSSDEDYSIAKRMASFDEPHRPLPLSNADTTSASSFPSDLLNNLDQQQQDFYQKMSQHDDIIPSIQRPNLNQSIVPAPPPPPSYLSSRIEQEMKDVRLQALEKEIQNLQEVLLKEKQKSYRLGMQVQQLSSSNIATQTTVPSSAFDSSSAVGYEKDIENKDSGDIAAGKGGSAPFISPTKHIPAFNAVQELLQSAEMTLRELNKELVFPIPITESLQNSDNFKYLIRKYHSLRKQVKQEMSKLIHYVKQSDKDGQKETIIKQLKETVNQLREEIIRKNKLYHSLKESKTQDNNTLDTFKQEIKNLEETIKRLQRNLISKDQMIKDLKAKYDTLQQQQNQSLQEMTMMGLDPSISIPGGERGGGGSGGGNDNLYLLSAPEMRAKIKELELERARQRIRVQSLKDKIHEQEEAIAGLQEEKNELSSIKEKHEKALHTIQRKDTQIQSYQQKIEQLEQQLQTLQQQELQSQVESDKKIRQLQRQIEIALKHQRDYEEESKLLRERLIEANTNKLTEERLALQERQLQTNDRNPPAASTAVRSRRASAAGGLPPTNSTFNRAVHFSDEAGATDDYFPSTVLPGANNPPPPTFSVPSSLSSAKEDLQDVIQAIGGSSARAPTASTIPTSQPQSTADNLLQRLTGLSSILFADNPNQQSSSQLQSSAMNNPFHVSSSPSNVSSVVGNISGGVLDTSSTSSSSLFTGSNVNTFDSSQTNTNANAIERRLSALVSAALQSPPRVSRK